MTLSSRWMGISLRAKVLLAGMVLAVVLCVVGVATYAAARRAAEDEADLNRTLEIGEEMRILRASETDASAQIRAYWITQDEAFSNRVRQDLGDFDSALQKLVHLTMDDPGQRKHLSQLAGIERSRVERIFDAMARFRSGLFSDAELRRSLAAAEEERARMQDLIGLMEQEHKRQLGDRLGRLARLRILITAAIWQILGTAAASILAVWLFFAQGIRRRIGLLRKGLEAVGGGEFVDFQARDQLQAVCQALVSTADHLHQKNLVFENALDGIAQIDGSGRYVSFNRAYGEITGVSRERTNILACIHPDDLWKVEAALADMRRAGRGETQARILRSDRSILDAILTMLPLSGERVDEYYVFLRDNTCQKSAEAALVRAKDAAVAANLAKTSFLAKIGHEIRTPLNAILGSADLLAETSLAPDQAEYVNIFRRNSRRLVTLINDFLDFSRIEAGAVHVDQAPFRIRQNVYEVIGTFRDSAVRKGLALDASIDTGVPEWLVGDSCRMQQVLTNLVSNAVKYTPAGRVEVRVAGNTVAKLIRVEVSDTGLGIPAPDRERIFAPFTQLKDPGVPVQGSGLGLTICRELVQLMNGEIGVMSEEGSGSTFYFEVPLEPVDPRTTHFPEPDTQDAFLAPGANRTTSILIAEDSEDNRLLLQSYLKNQPVSIHFAENGQQALDALKRDEKFDLILMDLDMPVMDGFTAARLTRAWQTENGLSLTPIVALSAHAIHDMVRASLDAGCVAHVAKPVDRRTLIETIARYTRTAPKREKTQIRSESIATEVAALVPNYLASQSKHIEDASEHLTRRDFDPIRRFGHNLKGTGRGYGFPEIEKMGRELEYAAKEGSEQTIAQSLEALRLFVSDAAAHVNDSSQVA